jgi:hypothetical protein
MKNTSGQFGRVPASSFAIEQVRAQQFVQALEARVVLRDADVEQLRPLPELDPRHRPHAEARSIAHEVGMPAVQWMSVSASVRTPAFALLPKAPRASSRRT